MIRDTFLRRRRRRKRRSFFGQEEEELDLANEERGNINFIYLIGIELSTKYT